MTIAELFQLVIDNYPDQLEGLITPEKEREVLDAIIAKLSESGTGESGNRIIEGCRVFYTGTGYVYGVTAGIVQIDGALYELNAGTVTLDPSDPTLRRIDNIVATTTGFTFNKGTPADPAFQPEVEDGQVFLTFVIVEPDTTQPAGVVTEVVYDEDDEWETSFAGQSSGNSVDFLNTEQVLTGSVSAKFIEPRQGLRAIFDNGSEYLIDETAKFIFNFYLPAQMNLNHDIQFDIRGTNGNTVIGGWRTLPIQKSNLNSWQTHVIEASELNFASFSIEQIWIRFTRTGGPQAFIAFWVDNVQIQTGVAVTPPGTPQTEDIVFPIVERGKSKGVVWRGGTDQHSIYTEEDGDVQGGGGFYERTTWVFEISDNDEEIPEIEDRALWAFRRVTGIRENLFEIRRSFVNFFVPIWQNGLPVYTRPLASTGSEIRFDRPRTYGSISAPITTATLTDNNTDLDGFTQVIFHQAASLNVPGSWTEDEGSADYDPAKVAVIYVEAFSSGYKRFIITYDK